MQVFGVTAGCYSDRDTVAMFSSKEKAQEYIDKMKVFDRNINSGIHAYEVDEPVSIEYVMGVWEDGDIEFRELVESITYPRQSYLDFDEVVFKVPFNMDIEVMKKSVRDQYAMWKAQKEGIA